jgi:hypothetical protein
MDHDPADFGRGSWVTEQKDAVQRDPSPGVDTSLAQGGTAEAVGGKAGLANSDSESRAWDFSVGGPVGDAVDMVAYDARSASRRLDAAISAIETFGQADDLGPTMVTAMGTLQMRLLTDRNALTSASIKGTGAPEQEASLNLRVSEVVNIRDSMAASRGPIPDLPTAHPCMPFSSLAVATLVWASLAGTIPGGAAAVTRCPVVENVWKEYFQATSTPFPFSAPADCVGRAAGVDVGGKRDAELAVASILDDILLNLKRFLPRVPLNPWPGSGGALGRMVLPVEQAVTQQNLLHPDIDYVELANPAANLAGDTGRGGNGSDIFGDDDRVMGGEVEIIVVDRNPSTGYWTGRIHYGPRIHVKDTVDFCPGNMGPFPLPNVTIPMSRLEATGLTRDVPITIDYGGFFASRQFRIRL